MSEPRNAQQRADVIARLDRAFSPLITALGPAPERRSAPVSTRFSALVNSITHQLLATKAAATIHRRVIDACGGDVNPFTLSEIGPDGLRALGLSRAKAAAMVDLADRVRDGRLDLRRHGRMDDLDVISEVVAVRGVGPWTAQIYLMHTLGRHDVWPASDLGVRRGWSILHGDVEMVAINNLREAGGIFQGFRSDVAWYCWRAIDFTLIK